MSLEEVDNFQNKYPNNNDGIGAEITQNVIQQTTPQGFEEDAYAQQLIADRDARNAVAPIGPQGAALYPGLNHNINVGATSGSEIGSGNIYVPGGNIMAIDPVLARRKAIDDAAKARAAEIKPFEYADPTKLKDANFQESFNKMYHNTANEYIEKAKAKYGKDFGMILQDQGTKDGREFLQTMSNFEFIGREMDQITNLIAEIDTGLEEGNLSYSAETLKIYDDYKKLIGDFENGEVMKSVNIADMHKKLQGALSIEEQLNKTGFLSNIMGKTSGYNFTVDNGEYYSTKTNKKITYKEALGPVMESLTTKGGPLAEGVRMGIYTQDDVLKALQSKFKDQQTQTGSITKKDSGQIADETISEEGQTFDQAREDNNYTYNEDGTLSLNQAQPGKVNYRHDVNLSGKTQKITVMGTDGTMKTIPVQGIPLTQATFLNGDNKQNFEETSYAKVTGFSSITRGGKQYVVANTSTVAPAKISYKKVMGKWEEITAEEWKGLKKRDTEEGKKKYKRLTEYREVQVPMILVDEAGKETGTFNEILQNTSKNNRPALEQAFKAAQDERTKQAGPPSGELDD